MARLVWDSETRVRGLLGVGYWVQGLRCFPWLAVNFFLKDALGVDPSTLQLLQSSSILPMVAKPFYGLLSDAVYIFGQHRIPYIAIGAILQVLSWLAIAILARSSISIFSITLYLLLSNLGGSICEVANDAMVAEIGKQPTNTSKDIEKSYLGELQSYAWIAVSVGGILGNLLGGIAISRFSPQTIFLLFGFVVALQFFLTLSVSESSLGLPKSLSSNGIRKQLSLLILALQKPEIAYSVAWMAASYAVIPVQTITMFFYQTQFLKIDSSVVGISKVFGVVAVLVWSVIYNRWLKSVSARKLIITIQATMAVFMLSDVLFANGIYQNMGVPDSLYVIVFSGLLEVMFIFKFLPFNVLIAQLCPQGCEGSLMAFVGSAMAFAVIVSGYFGVVVASSVKVTGSDFSGFPRGLIIQALCTLLPLFWSSYIHDEGKLKTDAKKTQSLRTINNV